MLGEQTAKVTDPCVCLLRFCLLRIFIGACGAFFTLDHTKAPGELGDGASRGGDGGQEGIDGMLVAGRLPQRTLGVVSPFGSAPQGARGGSVVTV
jgi:hypothetical protein